MRSILLILTLSGLLALCSPSFAFVTHAHKEVYPTYPKPNLGRGNAAEIKRGEYLVKAGDCISCHTDKDGKPFAGNLAMQAPFGPFKFTFYSPNITADKDTGIGRWTNDDFYDALHSGHLKDKGYAFPIFPYPYFTKLTRPDIEAIKSYLFSIPPVNNTVRKNDVPFPFNIRLAQIGWQILFFHKGEFKADPKQSKDWNRGAYLVQGPGHCAMCHTKLNIFGAPKMKYYLAGAIVPDSGFFAPDITARGLGKASNAEVMRVFLKDQKINHEGRVGGPMAEVNHNSLDHLTKPDLNAIITYLKTVHSATPPQAKVASGDGKGLYAAHCAMCHTSGAAGAPKLGDAADWDPRIKQGMDTLYNHAIHGFNSMPAKGTCSSCSTKDIKDIVDYMVEATKGENASTSKPKPKPAPKLTLKDGQRVYDKVCVVCHRTGGGPMNAPKLGDKAAWTPRIKMGMDSLFIHAINGYKEHPALGDCPKCSNTEVMAAVKYMVFESKTVGNYKLW